MRYALLTLVAAAALVWSAPASAQLMTHPRCASMRCREVSQKLNLQHARFLCHYGRSATRRWGCQAVRWLTRELRETKLALRPRSVVLHWRGWSCITHGSSFDNTGAHEGNGYNPAGYSGPLGMTTPWLGHMPPGRDWVHSDARAVYAIAEREAAKRGFADSWMRGQWPLTYPPCAGYFN